MIFEKAKIEEFQNIKQFYWNLIDEMKDENDKIGWKKGIYPTDEFLIESLKKEQLFILKEGNQFVQAKEMFYEDTGWTEYKIYELNL